jgi:hypothetical protein
MREGVNFERILVYGGWCREQVSIFVVDCGFCNDLEGC